MTEESSMRLESEPNKEEEKKERERRYLVKYLPPEYEKNPIVEIPRQGYIAKDPDGSEVRIREEDGKFILTVKSGAGRSRGEIPTELTKDQFENMWSTTDGKRVNKTRYNIPFGNNTIELNFFHDSCEGMVLAEVEFTTDEEADNFVAPPWLGEEVTDDTNFNSFSLATTGMPEGYVGPSVKQDDTVVEDEPVDIVPEYEKEAGIARIIDFVKEKIAAGRDSVVVQIAGGSASGKTSAVAKQVKDYFGNLATIFSMDDYYKGVGFMNAQKAQGIELNWDQPEAVDIDLFEQQLAQLKTGEAVDKPVYSMKTGEREGTEKFEPAKIIVVEGLFALNDQIKNLGDVKAFVDIGFHGRILRRILRDVERTGQRPADILKYFSEVVEPMHEKYILDTKQNADFIVRNEYNPEIEAKKSGLQEFQMKYKTDLSEDTLRKAGANRIGTTTQVDYYYNPKDRDLIKTDEMLRIRDEAGIKILTYKGPRTETEEMRVRPKFEFEIDPETEKSFLEVYGSNVKVIQKNRKLYEMNGVVFSVDEVYKYEKTNKEFIGNFIEFRSSSEADRDKMTMLAESLNLDQSLKTTKSYFEM